MQIVMAHFYSKCLHRGAASPAAGGPPSCRGTVSRTALLTPSGSGVKATGWDEGPRGPRFEAPMAVDFVPCSTSLAVNLFGDVDTGRYRILRSHFLYEV